MSNLYFRESLFNLYISFTRALPLTLILRPGMASGWPKTAARLPIIDNVLF
jgi:hypothetical protein